MQQILKTNRHTKYDTGNSCVVTGFGTCKQHEAIYDTPETSRADDFHSTVSVCIHCLYRPFTRWSLFMGSYLSFRPFALWCLLVFSYVYWDPRGTCTCWNKWCKKYIFFCFIRVSLSINLIFYQKYKKRLVAYLYTSVKH